MTMAWTAQTGLGPRKVALSLKVFIVVMFYVHERLGICTAQRRLTLPEPLPDFLQDMRDHFCSKGKSRTQCNDNSDSGMGNPSTKLCQQICNSNFPNNCWDKSQEAAPLCNNRTQNRICGYKDATVCQYNRDERGTCVYRTNPPQRFCICQNQEISYRRCSPADPDPTPQVNTIVFGSLFALLFLSVIIGAVVLRLRRQRRLQSFMNQAAKPAELSSVQLEARNASRAKLPDLPVPGSSMEYSYAYDHRPAKPGAKEDSDQDDHTYYSVGEGVYREGNHRYVLDGQRPATKKLDTATDNAKDHPHFVLNRTDSCTGVQSKEVSDEDYTPLVPTGNPKSLNEQFGDEVESPTSANKNDVTPSIDSPTEDLSNGDDSTYFSLIQAAAPKSPVKQSGYEDAKILTSESHDSTSPTKAQCISCDDNTYTPLVRTAEPKSQKEHSGYEAAIIPNPGLAADGDDTSHYDHLERKEENKLKEGALSTTDVDDYQHLVNN